MIEINALARLFTIEKFSKNFSYSRYIFSLVTNLVLLLMPVLKNSLGNSSSHLSARTPLPRPQCWIFDFRGVLSLVQTFAILKLFVDDRLYLLDDTNTGSEFCWNVSNIHPTVPQNELFYAENVVWCDTGSRSTILRLIF